jgi:2-keto-4-pentenoate hydratase/2-oxohepta-3-ene-1,7-dioic acid hydratase in catechol pathway
MIFLTFKTSNEENLRLGIKTAQGVVDVKSACASLKLDQPIPYSPSEFFDTEKELRYEDFLKYVLAQAALASKQSEAPWLLDEAKLELGPCVPNPGKIICIGVNYRSHAEESGHEPPPVPVLFSKFNNAVAAPNASIPLPNNAFKYDYEVELAVVIGRRARCVPEDKALDYVLGYCNANDISARDLQRRTSQWLLGKTLDKFFPLGPYLVTADDIEDPQDLPLRCWLNGELRQNSSTADMIFSVAHIISYASQYMTLERGDVISTGTPEGVILGRDPKVWMKPGDEVTVEVGPLGRLTNRMVREKPEG